MPVVTTPGSSSTSCHSGSGWLDIWRAKPVFVLQPIAEQDTFSRQTYRVSPRQYAGYEVGTHAQPHSDVQWDCHTLYQDIVLRTLNCRLGALDNSGLQSRVQKLGIVDIGTCHNHTQRAACLFHKNAPLGPSFASIGGVAANQVPPKRALPIDASADCHSQSTPPNSSQ